MEIFLLGGAGERYVSQTVMFYEKRKNFCFLKKTTHDPFCVINNMR